MTHHDGGFPDFYNGQTPPDGTYVAYDAEQTHVMPRIGAEDDTRYIAAVPLRPGQEPTTVFPAYDAGYPAARAPYQTDPELRVLSYDEHNRPIFVSPDGRAAMRPLSTEDLEREEARAAAQTRADDYAEQFAAARAFNAPEATPEPHGRHAGRRSERRGGITKRGVAVILAAAAFLGAGAYVAASHLEASTPGASAMPDVTAPIVPSYSATPKQTPSAEVTSATPTPSATETTASSASASSSESASTSASESSVSSSPSNSASDSPSLSPSASPSEQSPTTEPTHSSPKPTQSPTKSPAPEKGCNASENVPTGQLYCTGVTAYSSPTDTQGFAFNNEAITPECGTQQNGRAAAQVGNTTIWFTVSLIC